jgi:hypothetical protein
MGNEETFYEAFDKWRAAHPNLSTQADAWIAGVAYQSELAAASQGSGIGERDEEFLRDHAEGEYWRGKADGLASQSNLPEGVNLEERAIGYDDGVFKALSVVKGKRDEWQRESIKTASMGQAQYLSIRVAAANEIIAVLEQFHEGEGKEDG